ncbi:MAG: endonuclease MutS2 [Clostridia bacterium]|nr:endonuclease MutS2 [Clostridia bacterium]
MDEKSINVLEFDKIKAKLEAEAVTAKGKARAAELTPSSDKYIVERSQTETAEAESLCIKKGAAPISPIGDVTGSVLRAEAGGTLSPRELLNCAHTLRIAGDIAQYIDEDNFDTEYPYMTDLCAGIFTDKRTSVKIISAIISEEEIADDASSELASIRRRIKSLGASIRETLNNMIKSQRYSAILQDAIVTMRGDRFVIPVKSENRSAVPGIVHDSSSSGATVFIEPMAAVEINNKISEAKEKEKEEIERILSSFSAMVAEDGGGIKRDCKIITALDFAFAKGKLALKMRAVRPEINDDGIVNIKKGRHPLIDAKVVVPTDIYLGESFDTLVITGPNTGGKTVALKTLGLLTLMAQAGLHIPASSGSRIAVFENVFADIGDEQSIEQSLSTFSAHMVNIVRILKEASYTSLVLFDELGAGTDPVEGAALAVAILERMKELGAKTAATTHYSEIKLYALETDRVENAACEFDVATLRPTYRLLIGVPGKSNAFAISKRLGLDEGIIDRASRLIDGENTKFEDVISSLEETRRIAETEREEAEAAKLETAQEREKAEKARASIEKQKENILRDARRDAKRIYEQAKREADEIIKEMRDKAKNASLNELEEERRKIKKGLGGVEEKLSEEVFRPKNPPIDPKSLLLGQSVEVTGMGQVGKVLTLPDKNGNLTVQVGILKITTNVSALRLVKEDKKEKKKSGKVAGVATGKSLNISPEVDLRGQTIDEAIINLDKYLDDAVLAGLESVRIIHGKGTGALRSGVQDFLKRHKHVASYRMGAFGEGDSGVTVVTLR